MAIARGGYLFNIKSITDLTHGLNNVGLAGIGLNLFA
jgi:hypothetical protein